MASTSSTPEVSEASISAPTLLARALSALGVKAMFGVVGIPVTAVATAAQAAGIRYFGFRNEQAAGFAAAAFGYLTGTPGVLLTVSGPGCVNGLAGLGHAHVNAWPMVMVSGSCSQGDFGKGDFQELDQVALVRPFAKYAGQATRIEELVVVVQAAVLASVSGRPGGTYIDIPADVLHQLLPHPEADNALHALAPSLPLWDHPGRIPGHLPQLDTDKIRAAAGLLREAQRPLVVFGMGAAYGRAEGVLKDLVEYCSIPFVPTPMGKGVIPDTHPLCAGAARSLALSKADVALVVGAPLNWLLHFGEAPKWAPGVKFILVDVDEAEVRRRQLAVGIVGEPREVLQELLRELKGGAGGGAAGGEAVEAVGGAAGGAGGGEAEGGKAGGSTLLMAADSTWRESLQQKVASNTAKMAATLSLSPSPLNFHCPLRILRDAIAAEGSPAPILVSEGANTMDIGRAVLDQSEPRTRLDAATWGTMGVGLGYAVAAAQAEPGRLVVALEGDSAFGFSGMEVETLARYKLPVVIVVMNNNGVYGGDRRAAVTETGFCASDPAPTAFVPGARYDLVMEALGGKGYYATSAEEFEAAVKASFVARQPALINVVIDPFAGAESGRMTHKN